MARSRGYIAKLHCRALSVLYNRCNHSSSPLWRNFKLRAVSTKFECGFSVEKIFERFQSFQTTEGFQLYTFILLSSLSLSLSHTRARARTHTLKRLMQQNADHSVRSKKND